MEYHKANNVKIGKNCAIGKNVVIHDDTMIGDNVTIHDNAVLGKKPMKSAISDMTKDNSLEPLKIGDNCIIGTNTVLYRGALIGDECMIADMATIRENVTVGKKCIIGRGVAIENNCTIGYRCKIETNAYITAHSILEDYVFVGPGVMTSNDNYAGRDDERHKYYKGITVRKGGRIGVGATILPGKTIGEDSLVGGGAVVTCDIPPKEVWVGNPAKKHGMVKEEQLLENQDYYEG
jgi:UDP-2-acetamido-3-amino-2,3-dideoxy-glucuronate N-acetyltransferase